MSSKLKSYQIFHIARKTLSNSELYAIFGKSIRHMTMWAADPKFCEETRRNPLDRVGLLVEALDDHGRRDVAAAALEYLSGVTGLSIKDEMPVQSDKQSVDGEIADLTVAMGTLAAEIRAARADDEISTVELIRIKNAVTKLEQETAQLLDAAGISGGSRADR